VGDGQSPRSMRGLAEAGFAVAPLCRLLWRSSPLSAGVLILKPIMSSSIQSQGAAEVHPDVALVERARAGDVAAFEKLVRQYDRQVFRIAQHIVQNREDAEDVVQDAFLKAYEKLDQFQGNSKFYTWLVRIAVNEALMRLRKRRTGRMVSIDEDVETEEGSVPRDLAEWRPDPEAQYGQSEMADILRKTIQGLPPGFRVVFALRDVEGLSTEETAETLGLSIPAVKSRLLRARLQLRERLSRYFKKRDGQGGKETAALGGVS
jgi:RNA polymerase sigma-70 factor (ECF subfamily)